MKYLFAILAVLSTLLSLVAADVGSSDASFLFLNRKAGVHEHPEIAKRQVQPGQPGKRVSSYRTVVARSPFKEVKRESLSSTGVGSQSKLAVYNAQNTLLGYIAPSTAFKGDYTIVDPTSPAAIKVLVTYGTTDVQRLPIINPPAGTFPYLAGVAGAANTGNDVPPYVPSTDFGGNGSPNGRNYAYLSDANEVAYGAAKTSPNSDHSTDKVETGMFQLRLDGTLVPVWVNSDGVTVVPNQVFGIDASSLILMYGSQSSINAAYGPAYQGVTIRPILAV